MNNEDYVSYELALKLKECGFDEPCDHLYDCHYNLNRYADTDRINRNTNGHHTPSCSAPTLAHAQKWLREKHDIHIQIEAVMQKQWTYTLVDTAPLSDMYGEWHDRIPEDREGYPQISTYEQALSDGIATALELIKKGE